MRIHRSNWTGVIASLVSILLICGAQRIEATPILDQSFEPHFTNPFPLLGIAPDDSGAQTFTVGITGILTQVDVFVERNGFANLRFDVRPTISRVPIEDDDKAVASVTVPASTVPFPVAFLSLDVSSWGAAVSQGDVLAIVLSGNSRWFGAFDDSYPGGAAYFRRFPDIPLFAPTTSIRDVGFRTFVEPSIEPIPEPSTLMLISIGMFGLICWRVATAYILGCVVCRRLKDSRGASPANPSRRAAHEVRAGHQPQDRQSARPDDSPVTARAGG
jgi:hypothetical protein